MHVSPSSLSFTKATPAAQSVKVTGLASGNWTAKATDGISVTPTTGANDASFAVTAPGLRVGSPGTVTVSAPGVPSVTVSVALTA
jgi:hypothetical protein